jgi:small subunit ribosomal protein S18
MAKKQQRRRKIKIDVMPSPPKSEVISYKDIFKLKKYTSSRGKIIGRVKTGLSAKQQRQLQQSVKIARFMALLPYVDAGERKE